MFNHVSINAPLTSMNVSCAFNFELCQDRVHIQTCEMWHWQFRTGAQGPRTKEKPLKRVTLLNLHIRTGKRLDASTQRSQPFHRALLITLSLRSLNLALVSGRFSWRTHDAPSWDELAAFEERAYPTAALIRKRRTKNASDAVYRPIAFAIKRLKAASTDSCISKETLL